MFIASIDLNIFMRFVADNFENATALVVTFSMNNFKDDQFQDMAKTWEKAFLDVIESYESENITIAYSSEVGLPSSFFIVKFYNYCSFNVGTNG